MFSSQTSSLELYSPTRGLEAGSLTLPIGKVKEIEEDSYINLQIWDTPGDATPEDYAGFNLEINGFVVFADLSKRNYDESVMRWHKRKRLFMQR